jgi:hypothetical protein
MNLRLLFIIMSLPIAAIVAQNKDTSSIIQTVAKTDSSLVKKDSVFQAPVVITKTLLIKTTPDSAVVVLNDSVRGLTPLTLANVPYGNYTILLKKKGYYQKSIAFICDSASPAEINSELQKPGSLYLISKPSGAAVTINNEAKGVTPLTLKLLKPNEYDITFSMIHHDSITSKYTLQSGKNDTLNIVLQESKVYTDSLIASKNKAVKARKKVSSIIVGSVFLVFGLVILGIEVSNSK